MKQNALGFFSRAVPIHSKKTSQFSLCAGQTWDVDKKSGSHPVDLTIFKISLLNVFCNFTHAKLGLGAHSLALLILPLKMTVYPHMPSPVGLL